VTEKKHGKGEEEKSWMTRSDVTCQADLYTSIERRGKRGANGKMSSGRHGGGGDGGLDVRGVAGRCLSHVRS